jgi:hypothetical protein
MFVAYLTIPVRNQNVDILFFWITTSNVVSKHVAISENDSGREDCNSWIDKRIGS